MKHWSQKKDVRDLGLSMPGEWMPHTCCWMAWPCREGLWQDYEAVMLDYANVANAIGRFEPVNMLTPVHRLEEARKLLNESVEVIELPIDDSWARDSGPNFLTGSDELAGSHWTFNAWGEKYFPYDEDAQMGRRILEQAGAKHYFSSTMVAEGGGVTVDGEGTLITTESCFLNKNRNPNMSRKEVEQELCRTLGVDKVLWIPGDVEETETDGHIDGIAAFIEPGRVLLEVNPDKTDPHYPVGVDNLNALKNLVDARGRKLELEFIDEGIYHQGTWNGGCSSYINSYLANGAVIVPGYGYDRDPSAVETYQAMYPEREVIQVPIHHLALGGGGIHCVTQQQPSV